MNANVQRCYYCSAPFSWPEGLNRPPVIVHLPECPLVANDNHGGSDER